MKRSDLEIELEHYLARYLDSPDEYGEYHNLSKRLLDIVEKAGMLPPTIKNPEIPADWDQFTYAFQKSYHELYNTKVDLPPYKINEWEPEDEKEHGSK